MEIKITGFRSHLLIHLRTCFQCSVSINSIQRKIDKKHLKSFYIHHFYLLSGESSNFICTHTFPYLCVQEVVVGTKDYVSIIYQLPSCVVGTCLQFPPEADKLFYVPGFGHPLKRLQCLLITNFMDTMIKIAGFSLKKRQT